MCPLKKHKYNSNFHFIKSFRLLLSFGGIYPYILKFYYNFFTPENNLSELFDDNILFERNQLEIFLQSGQVCDLKYFFNRFMK